MMDSGIYVIKNVVNGKPYIGKAKKFNIRFSGHKSDLRRNKHDNEHLQRSWNKHGKDKFIFQPIYYCSVNKLIENEQMFLDLLFENYDYDDFYNMKPGATPDYMSEETKKKISEAHKGKSLSKDHKKKLSDSLSGEDHPRYGMTNSEEHRRKISENHADFTGENGPFYGREHTEETKQKISENQRDYKGEKNPNAILNKNQVKEIKRLLRDNDKSCTEIAKNYPVKRNVIYNIKNGESWCNISLD